MKTKLLATLGLLLMTTLASAHPMDYDPITSIGTGAQIILRSSLNIKPGASSVTLRSDYYSRGEGYEPVQCTFEVNSVKDYDRQLSGTLTVTGTQPVYDSIAQRTQVLVKLSSARGSVIFMNCLQNTVSSERLFWVSVFDYTTATIGTVRLNLGAWFEIKLGIPKEI